MSSITDLTMALNSTYGAILNQIQLSNLNFSINMTPFAAYITLKKSVQKDLHGVPSTPSPPVLYILQQEHCALQAENDELKVTSEILKNKLDDVENQNVGLLKEVESKNTIVDVLEANNKTLNRKVDVLENELSRCGAAKAATESRIKESKKKHVEEVRELQEQVTKLNKVVKAKNKVDKDLSNAREVIKTLKADKSVLKTNKTKLEGEIRTLEKRIKIISRATETFSEKNDTNKNDGESESKPGDVNANYITLASATASVHSYPNSSPSMVCYWNPILDTSYPQDPYSIPSMINHCVLSPEPPPEEEEKLVSKEEFLQLWAEHREQMRKDWAEILLKINNLNI